MSWRAVALLVALAAILWMARPIIGPFVVAAAIAYAFSPIVSAIEERMGWPRVVAVAVIYVIGLVLLGVLFVVVAGRLAAELELLANGGPNAIAVLLQQVLGSDRIGIGSAEISVLALARQIQDGIAALLETPSGAVHIATEVADLALQAILTLIATFYFLLDGPRFWDTALRFVAPRNRARVEAVAGRVQRVLSRWMRGQLVLIGLVALVVYVILGPIFHVPYALALGLLTGVLEIIPLVGPIAAAAIAGVVAFSSGGSGLALTVLVIYFVLRQVEDQVVMPIVIGRAVHLHPIVTVFAVLLGLSVAGILGGLLAVPIAAAGNVVLEELYPEAMGGHRGARSDAAGSASDEHPELEERDAASRDADIVHHGVDLPDGGSDRLRSNEHADDDA